MLQNLINHLNSFKTIGIFGYGKDGQSFHTFIQHYIPSVKVVIIDKKDADNYLSKLNDVDLIVKSPGISLHNLNIKYNDYNFSSTTQLFLQFFSSVTIGITGTKGKSTLSTILYNILQNNNTKSFLCGNIGIPVFDVIERIDIDTKVVMELSSHQLEYTSFSPHISVLINLFPEHLDYYETCDKYFEAKYNIFKYQNKKNKNDIAIINFDKVNNSLKDSIKTKFLYNTATNGLKYNHSFDIEKGHIHKTTLQILEQLIDILDVPQTIYLKTINDFKTLPHRLEYVGEYGGIKFINDSISTIPQTTIEAIKIIKATKEIDILIVGGYDRGVDYDELIEYLKNSDINHIVCVSKTGKMIYDSIQNRSEKTYYTKTLENATKLIKQICTKDTICLFSPAASSFDEFKNFEERGNCFKQLIV